eukprot:3959693-Pyramimonas_sp.AAC.1
MGGPPPRVVYAWVWRRAGGAAQWPDGVFTGSVLIPCEQSTGPGLESVTLMLMQTEELYNLYIIVISLDTRHSSYFTVLSPSSCLAHKVCPWRVQKALHDVKSPLFCSAYTHFLQYLDCSGGTQSGLSRPDWTTVLTGQTLKLDTVVSVWSL